MLLLNVFVSLLTLSLAMTTTMTIYSSGVKFHLGEYCELFQRTISEDAQFLAQLRVMDYSLLVGVHDGRSAQAGTRYQSVRLTSPMVRSRHDGMIVFPPPTTPHRSVLSCL